jgi:hypothetical protein
VKIGDGRLLIAASPDPHDILVLDAFSSDAIPVHLLTSEAFDTYLSRLSRSGVIALHISNRHFDLEPMLGRLAAELGLLAVSRFDSVSNPDSSGRESSRWVALSRDVDELAGLGADRGWNTVLPGKMRAWTDDFSNIWSVLHWRGRPSAPAAVGGQR